MLAVYMRISSDSQNHRSQQSAIQKWLDKEGYQPEQVRWYVDTETGKTLDRDEFLQLQADIEAGTVQTVVVFKLDRISRKLLDGVRILCDWLERGVRLVITTMQIDLSGPIGQMVATLLFAVAEMENEHRRERQAVGISLARERGAYAGGKPGRTKVKNGPRQVASLVRRNLRNSEIAKILKVNAKTVSRYLDQARRQGLI